MSFLKSVGQFLFGRPADIFNEDGQVSHKLPKKVWDSWQNRTKLDRQYNWRNHTGTKAGAQNKKSN